MQRCPECNSLFSEAEKFCEFDGAALVAAAPNPNDATQNSTTLAAAPGSHGPATEAPYRRRPGWQKTLAVIVVADLALGLVLFLVFYGMTRWQEPEQSTDLSSSSSVVEQAVPPRLSQPAPEATASPSIEPSPSPSVSPSPSPQTRTFELSSSPISTGGNGKTRSGPVIISLTSGATIEADEVWQTAEGLWYRQGTVVSLLSPNQINAIEKVVPSQPPSQASPTPSP